MNEVTMDKEYRYRCGEKARILCVDAPREQPVVSIDQSGAIRLHDSDGVFDGNQPDSDLDLIEVKPRIKRTAWANVYESSIYLYQSRQEADQSAHKASRLACIEVTIDCEHGEGLE